MGPISSGKDKRMKMTKLAAAAAVAAAGLSVAVWGCSGGAVNLNIQESCVVVKKDGGVQWASVEHYQEGSYTQEEMLSFARERVSAYNASQGYEESAENKDGSEALPVAVVSGTLENGVATLLTAYDKPERLLEFAQEIGDENVPFTSLSTGTVDSLKADLEALSWKDIKGSETAQADAFKNGSALVIKAEGQGIIKTEKKIRCASQNCTLQDANTVQTAPEGISYIIME